MGSSQSKNEDAAATAIAAYVMAKYVYRDTNNHPVIKTALNNANDKYNKINKTDDVIKKIGDKAKQILYDNLKVLENEKNQLAKSLEVKTKLIDKFSEKDSNVNFFLGIKNSKK
jgi:hypothetical protein